MKTSKYLAVIMSISAIWILLDVKSPAQGFKLGLLVAKPTLVESAPPQVARTVRAKKSLLAQKKNSTLVQKNTDSNSTNSEINKDFRLQHITITQNSSDKSLLTVKGFINNHSEQAHYVYYIVAKFIANDTAIKETIIPVNIDLEPGESKPFTHEISTDNVSTVTPETVEPLVVKYEYR